MKYKDFDISKIPWDQQDDDLIFDDDDEIIEDELEDVLIGEETDENTEPYQYNQDTADITDLIPEQYLVDESGTELKDYKFFCFNGTPKVLLIVSGRGHNQRQDFYDMDFKLLPFHRIKHPNSGVDRVPPKNFDKMIELAQTLSKGFPHIRVDFYNVEGKIYFGELTFFSGGGNTRFEPDEWDSILGSWLKLPNE
jgi:hypothetical protein